MKRIIVAACALLLTACSTVTPEMVGQAIQIGQGIYCTAVTPEGRQALRDMVSPGMPAIVSCPRGTKRTRPPQPG